jgi:aminoglycoside phosphotransferase (APT) family kinase protein
MTDALQQALERALGAEAAAPVAIAGLALIGGGASQETWQLEARIESGPRQGHWPLILRRPLGGSIYTSALDLITEYRVLAAAYASGVPTPRPFCLLDDLLGQPATLVERLHGESIGRKLVKEAAFAVARTRLPEQMGQALAAIHTVDLASSGLCHSLPAPPASLGSARWRIEQIEAGLDAIDEPHPALELCLRWLRRHEPPPPSRLVLVHGDFRIGNMLVGPDGLLAVIDWEFAHLGDPYEDLSWVLLREWRFGMGHLRFGGVGEPEPFFAAYAARTGLAVDPARVAYWEVLGNAWWALGTLNQTRRHLRGEQANLEFASLGRRCAEMELEALELIAALSRRG